ncbi:MAG TPA: ABC transporter permease [Bacteroidota bacterium]|jgi:putative ABC transport system permease protein|nr:ABC transporter permease [Bacteroidota bacterium]
MHFFREIIEGLTISLRAIRANKMRSVLTTVGIVIGIIAVTLMATAIEGVTRAFEKSANAFGSKVLYVQKFSWVGGDDWWKTRNRKDLEVDYADAIARQATLLDAIAPDATTGKDARFGSRSMFNVWVTGTTWVYQEASGTTISDGRFFSQEESDGGRPVCCIGANVVETLFPSVDPVGQTIKVGGYPYKVLAVFEKQGGLFGQFTSDNRIYIPINSFESQFGSHHDVTLNVRVAKDADLDDAREELRGIMRKIRRLHAGQEDDFNINQSDLLTNAFGTITGVIAGVGFFITGLSLFVGGIGIMNIMFVSVTERTREIGIRKAIGAPRRSILFQFLVEAALICLIGGLIGLIVSYILSLIINQVIPTAMPVSVVFIALFVSLLTGVVSGFLPAYRAAKMDPVEALRYE